MSTYDHGREIQSAFQTFTQAIEEADQGNDYEQKLSTAALVMALAARAAPLVERAFLHYSALPEIERERAWQTEVDG